MKIKLLSDELISVRPMSEKEYKRFRKESEKEWVQLDKIYTRRVIVEKWKPSNKYIVYGYTR